MRNWFSRFATACATAIGRPLAFFLALTFTVVWLLAGPLTGFSDSWQLLYNTVTTMSTGLIVFLLQHATNAGDAATHIKLDALLEADARDDDSRYVGIEDLTEPELAALKAAIHEKAEQLRADRSRAEPGRERLNGGPE